MSKKGKGPKKGGKKKSDEKYKDMDSVSEDTDESDDFDDIIDDIDEDWEDLSFDEMADEDLVWDNFGEGDEPVPSVDVETGMVVAKTSEVESPARKVIESLKARGGFSDKSSLDDEGTGFTGVKHVAMDLKSIEDREDVFDVPAIQTDELLSQLSDSIIVEVEKRTKDIETRLKASLSSSQPPSQVDETHILSSIENKVNEKISNVEEKLMSLVENIKSSSSSEDLKHANLRAALQEEITSIQDKIPLKDEFLSFLKEKIEEEEQMLIKMMERGISDGLAKVELVKGVTDPVSKDLLISNQDKFNKALEKAKIAEKQSTEVITRIGFAIVEAQRAASTATDASTKMDEIMSNTGQIFSKSEEILSSIDNYKKELADILQNGQDVLSKIEQISGEAMGKFQSAMDAADGACKRGDEFAKQIDELSHVIKEAHLSASSSSKEVSEIKLEIEKLHARKNDFKASIDKHLLKSEQAFAKSKASEEKAENSLKILSDVSEKIHSADRDSSEIREKLQSFEERCSYIENATRNIQEITGRASTEVAGTEQKLSEAVNRFNDILNKSEHAFEQASLSEQNFEKLNSATSIALERAQKAMELLENLTERINVTESSIGKVENKAEVLLEMALNKAKAVDVPEEVFEKINKASMEAKQFISRIDELKQEVSGIDNKLKDGYGRMTSIVPYPAVQVEELEVPEESELPLDLDDLLLVLVEHKASDLHLKVGSPPYVRLEGSLIPVGAQALTEKDTLRLIAGVMKSSQRVTFKHDRNLSFSYSIPGGMRFRVNAFYEKGMVSAAIRMMHVEMPTFEKLGLPVEEIKKIFDMKSGIILISGPTGSGKSTTVASIINFINQTKKQHIITIEDPIEFLYRDRKSIISQREVGVDTPSFYSALYEAIQQDPDVIMVGEVKDSQTVELVNVAAEAGKLVICMVRATNSVQAIERFLNLYTGKDQLYFRHIFACNFKGIVSQKLIRLDKADSMPIFEVIWSDPDMRGLILKAKYGQLCSLIAEGHNEGILSFSDSLNELVKSGKITPEEALKHKEVLLPKMDISDNDNPSEDSMLSWL
ncbi:MAG: PilT/PilU family type 4a pilus ATPase [Candidatus Eremiobacterota bacterium]